MGAIDVPLHLLSAGEVDGEARRGAWSLQGGRGGGGNERGLNVHLLPQLNPPRPRIWGNLSGKEA